MPGSSRSGRGDAWVWAQFALMVLVLALALVPPDWPTAVRVLGAPVTLAGGAFAVWAARTLGRSLTPFPRPLPDGELVRSGPYAIVRHPIYTGGLLFFLGWSLFAGVLATAATVALGVLWWLKAGVEERHLAARFPAYEDYRRAVPRRIV